MSSPPQFHRRRSNHITVAKILGKKISCPWLIFGLDLNFLNVFILLADELATLTVISYLFRLRTPSTTCSRERQVVMATVCR